MATYKPKTVCSGVEFKLTISYPKEQDVQAALWAWETFGGIGARTRRGFGALQLQGVRDEQLKDRIPADAMQARSWIQKKLRFFIPEEQFPENVPHLSVATRIEVLGPDSPLNVWKTLIEKLVEFRQTPIGRNGRSNWPEAEAIREWTGRRFRKYKPRTQPRKFPRAAFGLPIVFHFKDASSRNTGDSDPEDTTLQGPDGSDRLASPLILRPVACGDNRAIGLATLLEGWSFPSKLVLKDKQRNTLEHAGTKETLVEAILEEKEAEDLTESYIPRLNNHTNILQAFMDYVQR